MSDDISDQERSEWTAADAAVAAYLGNLVTFGGQPGSVRDVWTQDGQVWLFLKWQGNFVEVPASECRRPDAENDPPGTN